MQFSWTCNKKREYTVMLDTEVRGAWEELREEVAWLALWKDKVVEVVVICAAVHIRMVISPCSNSSSLQSPVRLSGVPCLLSPLYTNSW